MDRVVCKPLGSPLIGVRCVGIKVVEAYRTSLEIELPSLACG
jgi:hypothetical protein